jgi:hypothetical protein
MTSHLRLPLTHCPPHPILGVILIQLAGQQAAQQQAQ